MKLSIFINKMVTRIIFLIINFLSLSIYTMAEYGISLNCVDQCNGCISSNVPKDKDGNKILSVSDSCTYSKDYTSFSIYAATGYNGCGYVEDINNVYNICVSECQTCQKVDNSCGISASSTVICKPKQCRQKSDMCVYHDHCCDGLICLDSKCINPNTDCTPCNQSVESNKPCCNSSGINVDGKWKCASGGCGGDTDCGNGCCLSGSCVSRDQC